MAERRRGARGIFRKKYRGRKSLGHRGLLVRALKLEPLEDRRLLTSGVIGGVADSITLVDSDAVRVQDLGIQVFERPIPVADGIWHVADGPSPAEIRARVPDNINAADTTNADQLWSGGQLGLDLDGTGLTVGVWDAGRVRETHQEFGTRVTFGDSTPNYHSHSTHVAGTIGAAGVNPAAHGMANNVDIVSYNWTNDYAELDAAAGTIVASNHSYGYLNGWTTRMSWPAGNVDTWVDDRDVYAVEDPDFGSYDRDAENLDRVLYNNPELLSVWSAGNDRNDHFTNAHGDNQYMTYLSSSFASPGWYLVDAAVYSAPPSDGDGGMGYDTLTSNKNAKNSLVVGAIQDITNDPYGVADVRSSYFSSWGPTDDGRVKPDVVGNGYGLRSPVASSDTAYATYSGTSMSAPNVTGTSTLLIERYNDLFGALPLSATTKGLLAHTAFDGGNPGPDYRFGWGVVDAAAAATFLSDAKSGNGKALMLESTYDGTEQTWGVATDGSGPITATISWTDPAGAAQPPELDLRTPVLVNDLDIWITGPGGTVLPWTLDPASPDNPALQDKANHVDNIEQVKIDTPIPGAYTIHVAHTGATFSQDFSLLVSIVSSGSGAPVVDLPSGDLSYTENAPPTPIDANAAVSDPDSADFDTGQLTARFSMGGTANDRLAIRHQGNGTGQIGVAGSNVTFEGTVIGTFQGGTDGNTPLVVTFNSQADPVATQALLRNVTYENVSEDPATQPRTVEVVLTDGDGGQSGPAQKAINVTSVNDFPTVHANTGVTLARGGQATIGTAQLEVRDADNGPAELTLTIVTAPAHGVLARAGTSLASGGTFTQADINANQITYQHDGGTATSDSFVFTVSDGRGGTIGNTAFSLSIPGFLNFNDFSIDPYGVNQDVTGTTTVEDGGLTLHLVGNLWKKIDINYNVTAATVLEVDFKSGAKGEIHSLGFDNDLSISPLQTFTFYGTQHWGRRDFDNYLTPPNYTHYRIPVGQFYTGQFAYLFFVNDHDVGTPTAESYFSNVKIYEAGNAPVLQFPGGDASYTENAAAVPLDSGATVSDTDSADFDSGQLVARFISGGTADDRLAIRHQGTGSGQIGVSGNNVTYGGTLIGTFAGPGNGSAPLTITLNANADVVATQALLRNVAYRNVSDDPSTSARTVEVVLGDGDGGQSNPVYKAVHVTAVNDPPALRTNRGLTVPQGGRRVVTTALLEVTDVDNSPQQLVFSLVTASLHGVLSRDGVGLGTGATFTQEDINANRIAYQHDGGAATADSFAFTVSDGAGGTLGNTSFAITVATYLDFNNYSIDPYGVDQDLTGPVTVEDGGLTLHLAGNRWKKIDIDYTITSGTVLEFDFRSPVKGDIHALGFDNDLDISPQQTFTFYGTQHWGLRNFDNYASAPGYQHYRIPVGQFYTGRFAYLFFVNDHDVPSPTAESYFTNLKIVEAGAPPVVVLPGGDASYTENGPAVLLDGGATVSDADSNDFDGGQLAVRFSTGSTANDRLAIRNQGSGSGQIGVSGNNVTYGGTVIGTFTGGHDGIAPLLVTLNGNATPPVTQALLRNVTFANVSEDPVASGHNVEVAITDGDGGMSDPVQKTIHVTAVNDPPVLQSNHGLVALRGAKRTITAAQLEVRDVDNTPAELVLTVVTPPANGTLSRGGTPLAAGATFTQEDINARRIAYQHDGGLATSDSFVFTASDGAGGVLGNTTFVISVRPFLNFNDYQIDPYGITQDVTGPVTVEDGGLTLHMVGNRWKKIDFDYTITANTVLEFDFKSGTEGDIHGIGFDTDLEIGSLQTFKLHGTQVWGRRDFDNYNSSPGYTHYRIPVGQFYTGRFAYLFFVNDHDVPGPTADSFFSNVRVYENVP